MFKNIKQLIASEELQTLVDSGAFITLKLELSEVFSMVFEVPKRLENLDYKTVLEIKPKVIGPGVLKVASYKREIFSYEYYHKIFSEFLDDCYIYYSCIQNDGSYNVKYLRAINLGYVGKRNKIETYDS